MTSADAINLTNSNSIDPMYAATGKLMSEIPDDVFGGIYLDETGNLVVNVTDVDKSNINSIC